MTNSIAPGSLVKNLCIWRRKVARMMAVNIPTADTAIIDLAPAFLADVGRLAPIKLAIRVLAAMDTENGLDQVMSMSIEMVEKAASLNDYRPQGMPQSQLLMKDYYSSVLEGASDMSITVYVCHLVAGSLTVMR